MITIRSTWVLSLLALAPLACGPSSPSSAPVSGSDEVVELSTITYSGLNAVLADELGQVVLIDVWFRG